MFMISTQSLTCLGTRTIPIQYTFVAVSILKIFLVVVDCYFDG